MTIVAIVVLAIWALGIIATAAGLAVIGRDDLTLDAAMSTDPVRACLALAVVTVFWPAAAVVVGLRHLMERGQR
ncbi:hypothetical protein [Streptomyces sp. NK08204]|uniref:hypothetical protein n=1 Tax=Streptomyces sp. NK08204 TaxID=2873260 RepID=UPI001CEC3769|nr:hypothetical protein [Streptomyces sp. NK08204]